MAQAKKSIFQKKQLKQKKTSVLSAWQVDFVDYKNLRLLKKFISVFERILPRRCSGNTSRHQKMIAQGIKRARFLGLLPYTTKHLPAEGKRDY